MPGSVTIKLSTIPVCTMSKAASFIPLSEPLIDGNEWKYVKQCLDSGWVSSAGPFVQRFEEAICRYTGARHAVACVNGTSGLHAALRVCGVGKGDEVIVPTLTFIAAVNAVRYCGAEPVFMDCDHQLNIDPDKIREFLRSGCVRSGKGLKNRISGRIVKAILPVHIFGTPCRMAEIMGTARNFKLKVVEDATESLGSYYLEGPCAGRHTGTIGDVGVYSFNGNKIITTGGGGMLVTGSAALAKQLSYLVNQAKDDPLRFVHNQVGYNYRFSSLQAAMGLAQLENIEKRIRAKQANHRFYRKLLADCPGFSLLEPAQGVRPNYWYYALMINSPSRRLNPLSLCRALRERGIESRPVWQLNHQQKPYHRSQSFRIEKALWFWRRTVNLPCSAALQKTQISAVVTVLKELWNA